MTGKVNLKINQGATFKYTLTWLNENETPVNLTGMTALMHVRETHDAVTTKLVLSSNGLDLPDGLIVLGGTLGTITLNLAHPVTQAITWLYGVYDLELTDTLGSVHRIVEGKVTVSKEVTK